jgi:TPP-dependent pyruvate/acetoin dehydrogenase alpha subunit
MEIDKIIYEKMYLIRRMDEKLIELYPTDKIKSPVHLSIGQESIPAVCCAYLTKDDAVFGSYRSHAVYLAKGGDPKKFMAEMYGKVTGCCRGKGGSMHLSDVENGMIGTSAIVATTIPVAMGWAFANKLKGNNNIAVVFFGDGACDEGVFYESINFAVVKKIPILFVCENNGLAIHSKIEARNSNPNIANKIKNFGIYNLFSTSYNIQDLKEKFAEAISIIKRTSLPSFFEIETFRLKEHVGIRDDWNLGYRKEEEAIIWKENDPLNIFYKENIDQEILEIKNKIDKIVDEAVQFAEASPFPDEGELYADLF